MTLSHWCPYGVRRIRIRLQIDYLRNMTFRQLAPPGWLSHLLSFSAVWSPVRLNAQVIPLKALSLSQSIHSATSLPNSINSSLSSLWAQLWGSVLRAVPKKKTSHRKKRQRFMAGKALKDVTNLNTCSACGNVKRAHLLCPYCVKGERVPRSISALGLNASTEIRSMWKGEGPDSEVS